jgi:hypothetical protein
VSSNVRLRLLSNKESSFDYKASMFLIGQKNSEHFFTNFRFSKINGSFIKSGPSHKQITSGNFDASTNYARQWELTDMAWIFFTPALGCCTKLLMLCNFHYTVRQQLCEIGPEFFSGGTAFSHYVNSFCHATR